MGDSRKELLAIFATLECELLHLERFATRTDAMTKIFDFIETWYNPRRRHSAIEYLAPMESERRWQAAATPTG